jgi:hypothetical protein
MRFKSTRALLILVAVFAMSAVTAAAASPPLALEHDTTSHSRERQELHAIQIN